LKILYVVHQFFPRHVTGTETYTFELAASVKKLGHRVGVLCCEHGFSEGVPDGGVLRDEYGGLPVTRFCCNPRKWKRPELCEYFNPEFGRMSLDFFREEKPDLVHFTHNSLLSTSVIDSAKELRIPTVLTLTDFWYICPQMQLLRANGQCEGPRGDLRCLDCFYLANVGSDVTAPLRRLLPAPLRRKAEALREVVRKKIIITLKGKDKFNRAILDRPDFLKQKMGLIDVVIAPTKFLRDMFVKAGYEKERFRLINFGINLDLLHGKEKAASALLRVGFIGTLREHKGAHILLEALAEISCDDVEVQIYGSREQYPEYAARLKSLAAADERVRFCGTFPREEIGNVFANIDVLVMPSLWHENSPLTLLYALASRIPVIASDSGGLVEFIKDGVNGLLFKKGDSAALSAHIKHLAADRDCLKRMSQTPLSVKSIGEHTDEIVNIYRELVPE